MISKLLVGLTALLSLSAQAQQVTVDVAVMGMFAAPPQPQAQALFEKTFDLTKSWFLSDEEGVVSARPRVPYSREWSEYDLGFAQLIKAIAPGAALRACDIGTSLQSVSMASSCLEGTRVTSLSWPLAGDMKWFAVPMARISAPSYFPTRFAYDGILVIAAGNSGGEIKTDGIEITGGGDKVYAAALGPDGRVSQYTNMITGQTVFAATGVLGGNDIGTEIAAPLVAAALTNILQAYPGLSNAEAIDKLKQSSTPIQHKGATVYVIRDALSRESHV